MATATVRRPTRIGGQSDRIEKVLSKYGIDYELCAAVPFEEFDYEKGLSNQARIGKPLDETTVERYVEFARQNEIFPAVVAARAKASKKLVIADGNHRLTAKGKILGQPIDTYVIDAPPATIVALGYELNADHGLPSSEEQRLIQALWMVDSGVSIVDAAARLGLPQHKVAREKSKVDARARAAESGLNLRLWAGLSSTARASLATLRTDEGFVAAAQLASAANLTLDETREMVRQVNVTGSGKRQQEIVESFAEAHRDAMRERAGDTRPSGGGGHKGRGPRARWATWYGLSKTLPTADEFAASFQPAERVDGIERIDALVTRLTELRTALAKDLG